MSTLNPRKNRKEIIAWANGHTIQFFNPANDVRGWEDCPKNKPSWEPSTQYRVKPRTYKVGAYYPALVKGVKVVVVYGSSESTCPFKTLILNTSSKYLKECELEWIGEELPESSW